MEAAFSVGVCFHLRDLDKAHKEIFRILTPEGKLFIATSNPNMHNVWENGFEDPVKEGNRIEGKVLLPYGSMSKNIFYFHTEEEIINSIEENGFSIESVTKLGFGKEGQEVYRDEGIWMVITASKI